jgi:hypothetical protein
LGVKLLDFVAPVNAFAEITQDFIAQGGKGFNITVPFKVDAFNLATKPRLSLWLSILIFRFPLSLVLILRFVLLFV